MKTDQRQAIERLHAADVEAVLEGDHETLSGLWSVDAVMLAPGRLPRRAGQIRQALTGAAAGQAREVVERYDIVIEEVEFAGDYAFEWGSIEAATRDGPGGPLRNHAYNILRVLKRDGAGRWRIHRAIWNERPPGDPGVPDG